ncbi:MAG: hypothetical protein U5K72_06375 [Balneolaceae bacterium]|nr:hypothetical protein [Balneolaceae bacterium]
MKILNKYKSNILSIFPAIALLFFLIPSQTAAQHDHIFSAHDDLDADITSRLLHADAEYAMTTREGSVDLMLTDKFIVIQFSDRFLSNLDNEIRREADVDEASVLAEIFTSMISSGVHSLLNHALEIPIREIREVYYEDGKLHIIDYDGEEIFGDLEIDDVYIMEDFSRRDARRFVSEAERRMI